MISVLDGLPKGVLGFRATGKLMARDYTDVLAPALEAATAGGGRIRVLLEFAGEFDGMEGGAVWQDLRTGLREGSMSGDEAMCRESRADPLIHRVATPRWYYTTLAVQAQVLARAGDFRPPLLCLVGDQDGVADPAAVRAFFAAAGSAEKQLVEYPDGRHELLRDVGREGTFAAVEGWMRARAAEV